MLTATSSQMFGERGTPDVEVPLSKHLSSGTLDVYIVPNVTTILTISTTTGDCSTGTVLSRFFDDLTRDSPPSQYVGSVPPSLQARSQL